MYQIINEMRHTRYCAVIRMCLNAGSMRIAMTIDDWNPTVGQHDLLGALVIRNDINPDYVVRCLRAWAAHIERAADEQLALEKRESRAAKAKK